MRNGMGSWAFVFSALLFLAVWVTVNVVVVRAGNHAFDAYPFILLNLLLSCLAAMQGAILLNAAKRADQNSSRTRRPRLRRKPASREPSSKRTPSSRGPSRTSPRPSTSMWSPLAASAGAGRWAGTGDSPTSTNGNAR
jgi:hypothetical protein